MFCDITGAEVIGVHLDVVFPSQPIRAGADELTWVTLSFSSFLSALSPDTSSPFSLSDRLLSTLLPRGLALLHLPSPPHLHV